MEIKVCGSVAPYPKGNANCSSFIVSDAENKIMLDCGSGSTRYLDMLKDLKKLTVFISHYHPDHYEDLLSLMYATYTNHNLGYLDKEVPIYLPKTYGSSVPRYNELGEFSFYEYEDIIDKRYLTNDEREKYVTFHEYDYETKIDIGSMHLEFELNPHNIRTYSTKISSPDGVIVYSSDTGYEKNRIRNLAQDADLLICEASYLRGFNRQNDTHLYAYEAGKIASDANVKNLIIFHTYPEIPKEDYVKEAKEYFPNTYAANEGDIINLENHKILRKENKEEVK